MFFSTNWSIYKCINAPPWLGEFAIWYHRYKIKILKRLWNRSVAAAMKKYFLRFNFSSAFINILISINHSDSSERWKILFFLTTFENLFKKHNRRKSLEWFRKSYCSLRCSYIQRRNTLALKTRRIKFF